LELQETLIRACGAATITVAEVEELGAGTLDPNQIHIPGIFVQRIFQGSKYEKELSNVQ
jgi:3-oxoacid CoA-transferase subunit A